MKSCKKFGLAAIALVLGALVLGVSVMGCPQNTSHKVVLSVDNATVSKGADLVLKIDTSTGWDDVKDQFQCQLWFKPVEGDSNYKSVQFQPGKVSQVSVSTGDLNIGSYTVWVDCGGSVQSNTVSVTVTSAD